MQDKFMKKANLFIETEAKFPNDYLLSKNIDAKNYRITLTFGGQQIPESQIAGLKSKLKAFGLERTRLEVQQGFAYLSATNTAEDGQVKQLSLILKSKEAALQAIQLKMDSLNDLRKTAFQVFRELKVQYPDITSAIINPSERISGDDSTQPVLLVILDFSGNKNSAERKKMEDWMKVRLSEKIIEILFRKTSKP
jgi:hypothetical protein